MCVYVYIYIYIYVCVRILYMYVYVYIHINITVLRYMAQGGEGCAGMDYRDGEYVHPRRRTYM